MYSKMTRPATEKVIEQLPDIHKGYLKGLGSIVKKDKTTYALIAGYCHALNHFGLISDNECINIIDWLNAPADTEEGGTT